MTPEQMQQQIQTLNPMVMVVIGTVYLAIYIFVAFCLAKIAQKLGRPFGTSFLMAIIPIVNIILLLQMAGKPLWWIILMLIPIVNIVMLVLVWMGIAEKRGKPGYWGILMLIPIVNIFIFLKLAFGS